MSELNPLDSGSESGSLIIINQLLEENNFIPEEINPNQYQVISSSIKETNDQVSITPQIMVGSKRPSTDKSQQIKEREEEEIKQNSDEDQNNEKDNNDNDINGVQKNEKKKREKREKKSRKYEKDLISMKIQCHYMTFMIKLINEILAYFKYDKKDRFKDIEYSIKKDVKKENFNKLKTKKLYEIITEKVSMKKIEKNNMTNFLI